MHGLSCAVFIKKYQFSRPLPGGPNMMLSPIGNMSMIFIVGVLIGIDTINGIKRVIIQLNNNPLKPSEDI